MAPGDAKKEDGEKEEPRQLTQQEASIIKMLKQKASMENAQPEDKKHAFWDTQVRVVAQLAAVPALVPNLMELEVDSVVCMYSRVCTTNAFCQILPS